MREKITIDERVCSKHKMSFSEFLLAYAIRTMKSNDLDNMLKREILVKHDDRYMVTQHWSDVVDEILADSMAFVGDDRLEPLAKTLREMYLEGKTPDGKYYYRCNVKEIMQSLKKFFLLYGDYSDEDIIDATKRYVTCFRGNPEARVIKYFIIKDLTKEGKGIISDLSTFLENKESSTTGHKEAWKRYARNK